VNRVDIKPLTVNQAWQGKRFKTPKYKQYRRDVVLLLPKLDIPKDCKLRLDVVLGLSNKLSDIDNPLKPFIDCLQDKYEGFNDRDIYELSIKKEIVAKGKEFIDFKFTGI
jgi:Holliday junction resolvase RusA-like endonuclease